MTELFKRFPEARLKSVMADYRGAGDFRMSFEWTGDANIGSMMEPLLAREACECELVGVHTGH